MRIKRLKLTGFKSFVDPTELRIEPGLTGVVGPNGCGKSNLLEAIRWVMGESSPKSMRGGGMEDVIFAGTAARPQREFAEVSMLIDRPGTGGPEEGEVVRRIERGAGSAYRLDGRDVRAKDVALLFADAATGAHSPALVSQGKIAAVIAAKPAERRLMLEEAAGIAGLHVRRKDAEQKLRATETNLNRLDELLSDMEQRGAALRRQARAAERYRLISTQLRTAEARLIYARWRDAAAAAEAAKREAEVAEARVATTAEAQRGAAIAAADAARRLAEARAAALAARDAAADAARGHEAIVAERAALDRRIGELGRQSAALEADRAREAALAQDATTALARLAAEQEALAQRMAAAEATLPTLRPRREASEIAVRAAEQALAEAMAAEAAALGEARVAAAALVAARTRADRAQQEVRRLDQERAALGDDAALISQQAQAKEKRAAAERDADHAADAIIAAEASRDLAERERASASEALAGAEAELAALHAEQRALARPEKSPGGVRALDRVRAGPGYERALAAALGDELQAAIGEGPRAWTGASGDGDPALGDRLEPLILHVTAPPELMRRLAQIGVAERDDGQRLVVGQRLVTRDGVMRRWDGFVARDAGAEAAERLIRANRLDAIAAALP
ncbi:MAG: AAA family ATPase, partial [Sphingomonadaceae bacterium]|nr:AAA family ATPase [Sphingomonadaceae bacterium]